MEATAPEIVEKMQELLKTDRRLTCEELAREVGVSCSSALMIFPYDSVDLLVAECIP